MVTACNPDLAKRYLAAIAPGETRFTFQTFADAKDATDDDRKRLARVRHGTLDQHWKALERLNEEGAGIFVTVNETDLRGRTNANIVRIRCVFIDLDGAPLPRNAAVPLAAHVGVCTSPGRYHLYWRVKDVPLDAFKPIQQALAARYSSDPDVNDLARVMRLPGFHHRKGNPYLVRLLGTR